MIDISDRNKLTTSASSKFHFRTLEPTDGMALHKLVGECPPLDTNSSYCNLLQCSHFKSTSIAALVDEELHGCVTGYRKPESPDTLFIWQVAVHQKARGQGLARMMLRKLLEQPGMQDIRFVETSITPDNEASWRLFTGFATERHAALARSVMFEKATHFQNAHDTEYLVRIGPLNA